MDREAWWATVHGFAESDVLDQLTYKIFMHCILNYQA